MGSNRLLEAVVFRYLHEDRFKGATVQFLKAILRVGEARIRKRLKSEVEKGRVVIVGRGFSNPHIMLLHPRGRNEQVAELSGDLNHTICVYPSATLLSEFIEDGSYDQRPFTLRIARGAPQLEYVVFDPRVLELYRNDPRFYYSTNDIGGSLGIGDDAYLSGSAHPDDMTGLQTFGYAYDEGGNRGVAVFLRYLSRLSRRHQALWTAHELDGDWQLHPDYLRSSVHGEWPEHLSIFDAFLIEMRLVDDLFLAVLGSKFLRKVPSRSEIRPFGFMIRPTRQEYSSFVHLLDKMISENIQPSAFQPEIEIEFEQVGKDGRIERIRKGSIACLKDWLAKEFVAEDQSQVDRLISCFKMIRKERQRPAHALEQDVYDEEFYCKQRMLISEAFISLRTLRTILQLHPKTVDVEVPGVLDLPIWDR